MAENIVERLGSLQGALGGLVGAHSSAGRWKLASSVIESGLGDLTSKIRADVEAAVETASGLEEPLRSEVLELFGVLISQAEGQDNPTRRTGMRRKNAGRKSSTGKKRRERRPGKAKGTRTAKATKSNFSPEQEELLIKVVKEHSKASVPDLRQTLEKEYGLKVTGQKIGQIRRHL